MSANQTNKKTNSGKSFQPTFKMVLLSNRSQDLLWMFSATRPNKDLKLACGVAMVVTIKFGFSNLPIDSDYHIFNSKIWRLFNIYFGIND